MQSTTTTSKASASVGGGGGITRLDTTGSSNHQNQMIQFETMEFRKDHAPAPAKHPASS